MKLNSATYTRSLLFLAPVLWLAWGCSVTKPLEPGEYLLINNKIQVKEKKIIPEELEPYIQQKPNKKLFGLFRTNIALYNMGNKGKETKFRKWLKTKAGSAPVILDTSLNAVSAKQMNMYLGNRGFIRSTVSDTILYKKNKKAVVQYLIKPSTPYLIRSLDYAIADTHLASFVFTDTARCLVKRGENLDSYVLDDERTRITNNLLDKGFYRFSNIYIKYRIDTNLMQRACDVTLEIINQVIPSFDQYVTIQQVPHKRYFIDKIFIYPEYDHLNPYTGAYDTLVKSYRYGKKGMPENNYYFLHRDDLRIKPRTVAQSIFITPGSCFNLKDVNQTYSQLSSLQLFKYINIQFKDAPMEDKRESDHQDLVDCHVQLSRASPHSFSFTTDGTNSGGAFGFQGNLGYQNRNIFKGGQLLRLNVSGSLQMQATGSSTGSSFFNTLEFGVNAGIVFPQFLLPVKPERLSRYFKPKTSINIGYNYQHQQHYDRHISNVTFGYAWDQNDMIKHVLNPVEISLVKVYTDAYFDSVMATEQDERLKNQYTDHLVAGLKYTFSFSNQQVRKVKDFFYIRANAETGGNLIYAINELLNTPRPSGGSYMLFGLPYAQYVRPDLDFRYYSVFPNKFSVVYRFYGGIGIPYGNVSVLPFEKTFYSGGANGMRGWKMYTLGPGTYSTNNDDMTFNQVGDIQLEANVEYRFPVYDWIRGAVFVDAGNIWLLQDSQDLPGGKFSWPGFFSEIAIDAGLGLRLDFDFFIFRLDPAIRLYVPSYPVGDRWYFNKIQLRDIVWNFGIGYPF